MVGGVAAAEDGERRCGGNSANTEPNESPKAGMTLLIAWHASQVCDLPFGAVHKVKFGTGGADVGAAARGLYAGACGVKALYACATWEVARVLRPRGRRVHARLAGPSCMLSWCWAEPRIPRGRFVALTTSCRALMAHFEPQAAARLWVEIAPPRRVCEFYRIYL